MKHDLPRKLAAILYADVAGYSRLTGADEDGTHRELRTCLDLITQCIASSAGRVVHYAGDAVLADFGTVVDALAAAVAIQRTLHERNSSVSQARKLQFRIGVNLGDVIVDQGEIYGDGVNVAARLEGLAKPGGICVSDAVRTAAGTKLDLHYEFMGEQQVKNIAEPVRAYEVVVGPVREPESGAVPAAYAQLSDRASIAVLPFDNMSTDPEQAYFSDGITEDIITELSRFPSLLVIARNSSFYYKGRAVRVQEVAEELGVHYVVEGSVRRAGNSVRISAQLIDARSGAHLWAERYDRQLDNLFELQDEMAQTIAGSITPELNQTERDRAHRKPPSNLNAWEWYHRGLWHLYRFVLEDLFEAERNFQHAIDLDPEFGPAHTGLAYAKLQQAFYSDPDDPEPLLEAALFSAKQGCAFNEHDAMAHFVLGRLHVRRGEWDMACAEAARAVELNPSFAYAHFGLGEALGHVSRFEESLAAFRTAARLSPRDPHAWTFVYFQAWPLIGLDRFAEAVEVSRAALRSPNAGFHPYITLISALGHLGELGQAETEIRSFLQLQPGFGCSRTRRALSLGEEHLEKVIDGLRKAGLPQ